MVVRASSNNIYDYFRIGGYNIVPALCVANPFHKEVYDRGITQGQLITFQGTSSRTFRAVDVSSLMMNGRSVLDQLVSVYATELRSTVFPLVAGAERKMPGPLTNAYLLNSALSYVEKYSSSLSSSRDQTYILRDFQNSKRVNIVLREK